jgi:hypothetical protein
MEVRTAIRLDFDVATDALSEEGETTMTNDSFNGRDVVHRLTRYDWCVAGVLVGLTLIGVGLELSRISANTRKTTADETIRQERLVSGTHPVMPDESNLSAQ